MKRRTPRPRRRPRPSTLSAPEKEHPFVFFPTLESLQAQWNGATAYLAQSTFEREVPIERCSPYDLIHQARTVWPILHKGKNFYALLRGDILRESFLTNPETIEANGQIKSVGFVLTLHRFLHQDFFRPTVCETLARLHLASAVLRQAARDQKLTAFDFTLPGPPLRKTMNGLCKSVAGPFLAFHTVGGLPVHLSVAQLFTGRLSKRLEERPVFYDDRLFNAHHYEAQLPDLRGRLFPDEEPSPNR